MTGPEPVPHRRQLVASLSLTSGEGADTPCDVDVHEYALSCPPTVLAAYAYADGIAHHADLARHATDWLTRHGTACTAGLLATHQRQPSTQLELAIAPETLRPWLAQHRPAVLVSVLAAEVTASARWVHHDDLVARIDALTPDATRQALAALTAMEPDDAAQASADDFVSALLAASDPTCT